MFYTLFFLYLLHYVKSQLSLLCSLCFHFALKCTPCVFRIGAFGATFKPGSVMPSEAVIYAARPGLRLWKADTNGVVHTTFIFTNSSAKPQLLSSGNHSSQTMTKTETGTVDFPTTQFGLLQAYCSDLLVSYTSAGVLVVSPDVAQKIMFMYVDSAETILDVAVNRDEIFVLRKPSRQHTRSLVRLAQRPLILRHFESLPMTMTVSGVHSEAYRK